jgi:hypothetical protein
MPGKIAIKINLKYLKTRVFLGMVGYFWVVVWGKCPKGEWDNP